VRNNVANASSGAVAHISNTTIYDGLPTQFHIEGSLIQNNSAGHLFLLAANTEAEIIFSTIAANPSSLALMRAFSDQTAELNIRSAIVESENWITKQGVGSVSSTLDCVIGNQSFRNTGASNSFAYSNIDPQFINQAENNYQLQQTSPAIDYCSDFYPPEFPDLDGNQRGVTWAGPAPDPAPNPRTGDYDLGAFEAQPDRIFNDRFETTP